jgi:hypothetical protein
MDEYGGDRKQRDGRVDRLARVEGTPHEDDKKRDDARYEHQTSAPGHQPTVTRSVGSRGRWSQ